MTDYDNISDDMAMQCQELALQIRTLLHGHHPGVQSAVLADLLSMWVAGHHPEFRESALAMHDELVRSLIPVSEQELFGADGHPGTWDRAQLSELLARARKAGRHELADVVEEALRKDRTVS